MKQRLGKRELNVNGNMYKEVKEMKYLGATLTQLNDSNN